MADEAQKTPALRSLLNIRTAEDEPPDFGDALAVLWAIGWRARGLILPALAAAIATAILILIPPILLAELIDKTFVSRDGTALLMIGAVIAGIALIDGVCSLARRLLTASASMRLQRDILLPAFAAAIRLPVDHKLARDQGALGRTFEEAEKLSHGASEGLIEFALSAGTILVLAAALLYVDAPVGLAIFLIVSLLAGLHAVLARHLRAREARWFETRSAYWSHIVEALAYLNTLRFNSAHRFAQARFSERLENDLQAHLAVVRLSAMLDAAGRMAGGLIIAAIALLGGWRVIHGGMSVGDFVLLLSVGGSLASPVLALVKAFDDFQTTTISIARLSALAAARSEDLSPVAARAQGAAPHLAVRDLRFSFPSAEAPVLDGLTFEFAPGERVALIGPSGIGKSTLASLLFALRHPQSGSIEIDGVPADRIALSELRRRILVVPHEIETFTGSVAENIALDETLKDRTRIEAAAAMAGIDPDIKALPQGYDTMLGQGGVELSAGQKQRLGIARALLRRPDILILDESTSSLDLATEQRVLDSLMRHLPGTTIIAITHRASVVERMDRSVRLAD